MSSYMDVTKVQAMTDSGFPLVPGLEPALSRVFGIEAVWSAGRRPFPPDAEDQQLVNWTNRSHQFTVQSAGATNNIALLAFRISKRAAKSEVQQEEKMELSAAADTILNLCAAQAVCTSHIMAWMNLLQRQMWLHLAPSTSAEMGKQMLESPINPDGLFGPQYQQLLEHLNTTQTVQEQFQQQYHSRPAHRQAFASGSWKDRLAQQQQNRHAPSSAPRPSHALAPAAAATLYSQPPPQQQQCAPRRRTGQLAWTWSNPSPPPQKAEEMTGNWKCVFLLFMLMFAIKMNILT